MKALRSERKSSVLLCGYYGEHNLGDDALLQVLASQIPTEWELVVTSRDPEAVLSLVSGATTVNRRSLLQTLQSLDHVDALVLGGGSLLQDRTSFKSLLYYLVLLWIARFKGIPTLLWGQGLGPLDRPLSRVLVRFSLQGVKAVSWRDPGSINLAQRWGLRMPMVMGPDPVWCHPSPAWSGGKKLILCWRPTPLLDTIGWSVLLDAVDRFSSAECSEVIWLAFHADQDSSLWSELCDHNLIPERLRQRSVLMKAHSLEQVQLLFSEAAIVIAMRLHALILAATVGCPTAALSYDPKVKAAAELASLPWSDLEDQLKADQLINQWQLTVKTQRDRSQMDQLKSDADIHRTMLVNELSQLTV